MILLPLYFSDQGNSKSLAPSNFPGMKRRLKIGHSKKNVPKFNRRSSVLKPHHRLQKHLGINSMHIVVGMVSIVARYILKPLGLQKMLKYRLHIRVHHRFSLIPEFRGNAF